MKVDVIIPTLERPHSQAAFESLKYLPFDYTLHKITGKGSWHELINRGLAESSHDVIIMDDDVTLLPDTFSNFQNYYNDADIFGFKLLFPDGTIQHGGGVYLGNGCITHLHHREQDRELKPLYVCHVTASLTYIKRSVIDTLHYMEDLMGMQFEDVDWSWRALRRGFRILFIPDAAIHHESGTKGNDPEFIIKMQTAQHTLIGKHLVFDPEFEQRLLENYPYEFQPV